MEKLAKDIRKKLDEGGPAAERIKHLAGLLARVENRRSVRVLHLADSLKLWQYNDTPLDDLVALIDDDKCMEIITREEE